MPLFIRHFNDERLEDLEQRDLAETNGDDDHRSDSGIYGYTEIVDPALDQQEVVYQFAYQQQIDINMLPLVSMDDWPYLLSPDDPEGVNPVIKQTINEQLSLMVAAEALLRHAAEDNMGLDGHARFHQVLIPTSVITCWDPVNETRVSKAYYDLFQQYKGAKWVSIAATIRYTRRENGHLQQIR